MTFTDPVSVLTTGRRDQKSNCLAGDTDGAGQHRRPMDENIRSVGGKPPIVYEPFEPSSAALQKAFGDRYLYAGLGTSLDLGAKARVTGTTPPGS